MYNVVRVCIQGGNPTTNKLNISQVNTNQNVILFDRKENGNAEFLVADTFSLDQFVTSISSVFGNNVRVKQKCSDGSYMVLIRFNETLSDLDDDRAAKLWG